MLRYLLLLFCLLVFTGCQEPPDADRSAGTPKAFQTTQPSLLYFKNMRSSAYQQEELKPSRITFYIHNRLQKDQQQDSLGFLPCIASDWMNDRAFLVPRWTGRHLQPFEPLTAVYGPNDQTIQAEGRSPMQQTQWLLAVHQQHLNGQQVRIRVGDGQTYPLLPNQETQTYFETIVRDYKRLTER